MRSGVRLAVDVGSVRVGVARSDPAGTLAVPVETLRRGAGDVAALRTLAAEWEPVEVVVGLPLGLSGSEGAAAAAAREYATALAAALAPVPVRLVDERLTTTEATRGLQAAGRSSRRGRAVVDQVAAVIMLQHALDAERSTGTPPGTLLGPPAGPSDPRVDPQDPAGTAGPEPEVP